MEHKSILENLQRPDARIVQVKLKHHVPETLHQLGVTPLGVAWVDCSCSIPSTLTFGEDEQIVAMHVHGMCRRNQVIDYDPNGMVTADVVDVPLWVGRKRCVPLIGK